MASLAGLWWSQVYASFIWNTYIQAKNLFHPSKKKKTDARKIRSINHSNISITSSESFYPLHSLEFFASLRWRPRTRIGGNGVENP